MLHGESLPCRSELCRCFTASLFLAAGSRLRISRRVFALQVGCLVLSALHDESLLGRSGSITSSLSLPRRSESCWCFTASLFLAGRSRLVLLRRVPSLQVVSIVASALLFFAASLFIAGQETRQTLCLLLAGRSRPGVSRGVSSVQVGVV